MEISEGFQPEYFKRSLELHPTELPIRKKDCGNCPVIDGMYTGVSNDLKKCDIETRVKYSKTWFCHCTPNKACRGNWDNQNFNL